MGKEIPYVSEELMKQVDAIFAHGPQRAKSHDQRFGQWLINQIRIKYGFEVQEYGFEVQDLNIVGILFNMENPEFYELVKDYNV